MTGRERIQAALRGEWPDRRPVMLHNFMMAAREAGLTMRQYRESPDAIARTFIQSVERYGFDGIVLDIDTATLAGAVGVPVDLPEDLPARCTGARLASLEAVDDLAPPDVLRDARIQVWLEAARLLRRQCGEAIYLRGNCDQAPFSLAASVRSIDGWMLDLADPDNEPRLHRLLEHCTAATTQFVEAMAATGADMVSNGDSVSGPELISPSLYRRYAAPYEARVAAAAHALGRPWGLHICGRTDRILDDMARTGADMLELDYRTDVRLARASFQGRATFAGNIDPSGVLALGTPVAVDSSTRALLKAFAGEPRFILNAGCAIPATTPPENLRALMAAARAGEPS
jgi:MtaA/CmuA family methyltransferase